MKPKVFFRPGTCHPHQRWLGRLLWAAVLLADLARAQQVPAQFKHLSTRDGLPSNNIRAITQDRQGFLWIGTYGGLSRFDGRGFKNYHSDPEDTTTLGGLHIIDAWEDPSGYVWAAISNGGLARLNPRTDRVQRYMADRFRPGSLPSNDVTAVLGDRQGAVWVGTIEGLCRFDPRTETFTPYPREAFEPTKFKGFSMITDLLEDREGAIWVATIDQGISRIVQKPGRKGQPPAILLTRYAHNPADPVSLSSNRVTSLCEDHTGTLWVGTFDGLNRFDKRTGRCTRIYRHDPADPASLSNNWVLRNAIAEDRQGFLWIGTNHGLNRLDPARTHFQPIFAEPSNPQGLTDDVIQRVFVDRAGLVWVGTNDAGLCRLDPNRRTLSFWGEGSGLPNPTRGFNIRSVCQDDRGHFWIGTEGGGVLEFDPVARRVGRVLQTTNGLPTNHIGPMHKDRRGAIWIGMGSDWSSGTRGQIVRLDPRTGRFETLLPFKAPHTYAFLLQIYEDERGTLWFATGSNGLISFNPTTQRWKQYVHNPADSTTLRGKWSRAVVSDRRGHLWIGTDNGLDRLDLATGRIAHFVNHPSDARSLPSNDIHSLCLDRAGRLWVGTSSGLCQYGFDGRGFNRYAEKDGLADNLIANLLEDNDGKLWLNTPKGLYRFDPRHGTFTTFDVEESLLSGNIQSGACYKAPDGTLFFGGKRGIVRLNPGDLRLNPRKPPVVLTTVRLFDRPLPGSQDRQMLTLRHDQNSLTLEFAALEFTSPEKNQYAYHLTPFEQNWIYAGPRRSVTYTNLSPGTYTFRVKAANNDGLWNEQGTWLTLVILPAWWQTGWFQVLAGLALAGLVYAGYRYRLAQLHNLQTLRDQIARDLHDDVGGVLTSISFNSEAAQTLHRQGRFEDSYHLLQKIADQARTTIERMSDVVWSMRSDTNNAIKLVERLESFGRELLTPRNIRLVIETEPALEGVFLTPDVIRNLYMIGKEALHNAARHSGASEVRLTFGQDGGKVVLAVQDNGQGFEPKAPGRGNGLDSMKKRAEAIGAIYQLSSRSGGGTGIRVER